MCLLAASSESGHKGTPGNDDQRGEIVMEERKVLIEVKDLKKYFNVGRHKTLKAVDGVNFKIYQGEQYCAENNLQLGEITVSVPPDKAGEQWAKVTFMYDINGILYVSVQSCTGEVKEKEIVNQKLQLSPKELEKSREKLHHLMQSEISFEQNEWIQKLLWLYQFAKPFEKEYIGYVIARYEQAGYSGSLILKRSAEQEMMQTINRLEANITNEIDFKGIWYTFGDNDEEEESN